jgi:hypothetical protein
MEFYFMHHSIQEENMVRVIVFGLGFISIALALLFCFIIKYALFKGIAVSFFIGGLFLLCFSLNYSNIVSYHIWLIVSIVALVFGFLLVIKIKDTAFQFWKGLGIGIMIQAMIIMCLSTSNSIREKKYIKLESKVEIKSN